MDDFIVLLKDVLTTTLTRDPSLIGTLLRLLFHDCVPDAGCDGCVNLDLGANNGLARAVDELDTIFEGLRDFAENLGFTRADAWTFAALFAVEFAEPTKTLLFTDNFRTGRENCEIACTGCSSRRGPETFIDFLGPDATTHELIEFMRLKFGYTMDDTVAVMGAHTLGKALPDNAGFDGQWVTRNLVLGTFRDACPS